MEANQNCNYELIKIIIAVVTAIVAIITLFKGYREYMKSVKQKRIELFVQYRKRLKENLVLKNIQELLISENDSGILRLSEFDRYLFIGFYEEIALLVNSKIMQPEIAHYMFSYYAIKCWHNDSFWDEINRETIYWRVFREFVEQMERLQNMNLSIPTNQRIKFEI